MKRFKVFSTVIMKKSMKTLLHLCIIFCLLLSNCLTLISAAELKPWEKPINLALNKTATASTQYSASLAPSYAVDGGVGKTSRWSSDYKNNGLDADGNIIPQWIKVDLGAAYHIDEILVNFEASYAQEFTISGSLDDSDYFVIREVNDGTKDENHYTDLGGKEARYIKLDLKSRPYTGKWYGFCIYEIEVYDHTQTENIEMSAQSWVDYVESISPTISEDGTKIILPELESEKYEVVLYGSDNQQVVTSDGRIIEPLQDMKVHLLYKVQNKTDADDFAIASKDAQIIIPGTYQAEAQDNSKPNVLPGLREWKGAKGYFTLNNNSKLIVQDTALMETAKTIQTYFSEMLGKKIEISDTAPKTGDIVLTKNTSKAELGNEGYLLNIGDVVEITAPDSLGILYGGASITQILYQNPKELKIPKGLARDYPKYEVRSGMIDVGRVYIRLEYLEEITLYMSWFKMNEVQVHINDYWGSSGYSAFRLESERYPEIIASDGYYTKEAYKAYQKKVAKYGVDVITEIDTPYHAESFRNIDGVKMLKKGALDIRDPYSYTVIENLIDEYLDGDDPVIISDNFHIGTDEYDQNYAEEMRAWTDHFIKYVNAKGKKARLWGSLGGGTASEGFVGSTPVSSEATMNIWAPYWSDVKEMYKAGYDIINTCGGWLYIVPGGNAGYLDRLDIQALYDTFDVYNFEPNRKVGNGSAVMPIAHPQTKGAEFALWNDNTSFNIGYSEFDLFDRVKDAIMITSEKTWYGEKTEGQTSNEFMERVNALSNQVPLVNPNRYVASENEVIAEYDAKHVKNNQLTDQSLNHYNATLHGAQLSDDAIHFRSDAYMTLPMKSIGYPYTISMDINIHDYDSESVLFQGEDGTFYADIDGSGKVGYERLHGRYTFDYSLPKNKDLNMMLVCDSEDLYLYINGVLVSNGELIEKPIKEKEQRSSTFILPCETILKNLDAELKHMKIYNYAMSKSEIADAYQISGYRENLALNKPVEASGNASGLLPSMAVDGDHNTRWGSAYINGVEKPEWLVIDLEDVYQIDEIQISWEAAYASGYTIQGSLDNENYFDIKTITDGKGGLDVVKELGDHEVRYVKLALTTQGREDKKYGFSIWDIVIYENPNTQAKNKVTDALQQLETYVPGYEAGNLPFDLYQEWKALFESYYQLADEGKLNEFLKVQLITDIVKKMADLESKVLKESLVQKSALRAAYSEAIKLKENSYTPETYKGLPELIEKAKKVIDDPASTQETIDAALKELQAGMDALLPISRVIKNGNVQIVGNIADDVVLKVKEIKNIDITNNELKGYELAEAYDITLYRNNKPYQPKRPITVTIQTNKDYKNVNHRFVYVNKNGIAEAITYTYKDKTVSFTANHLSKYALLTKKIGSMDTIKPNPIHPNETIKPNHPMITDNIIATPNTGDSTMLIGYAWITLCAGIVVLFAYKKLNKGTDQ